jgi:hypothetical protein
VTHGKASRDATARSTTRSRNWTRSRGDDPGSNYDKARDLGIRIVTEEEFLKRAQA